MFEHCERTTDDVRRMTYDGRRIHGYTISSPMSQGSGELMMLLVKMADMNSTSLHVQLILIPVSAFKGLHEKRNDNKFDIARKIYP